MECYDLLGTGQVQLITGWDNGKVCVIYHQIKLRLILILLD